MALTTRQTTATGFTNKGSQLTKQELDDNFVGLYGLIQTNVTNIAAISAFVPERARAYEEGGVAVTTIASADTGVAANVSPTKTSLSSENIGIANNQITNNSGATKKFVITTHLSFSGETATKINVKAYWQKEVTALKGIGMGSGNSTEAGNLSFVTEVSLTDGQAVDLIIENGTNTDNITIVNLSYEIEEIQ